MSLRRQHRQRRRLTVSALALALLSCRATPPSTLESTGLSPVTRCALPVSAPALIRRITAREFDATVQQNLGVVPTAQAHWPPDDAATFTSLANAQVASTALTLQIAESAEAVADAVDFNALGVSTADAQARDALTRLAGLLYRRAPTADEVDRLLAFRTLQRQGADEATALRRTVELMLQAPAFLFRLETPAAPPGHQWLTGTELVTRLAFVFWSRGPDAALLAQAQTLDVAQADQVRALAAQMLDDPRAREGVGRFHVEWLGANRLRTATRADSRFEALRQPLQDEVAQFGAAAVLDEPTWHSLWAGRFTYMNDALGGLYGVPLEGAQLRRVPTTQLQRGGLLTLGGVLAAWSKANESSPVLRGRFVRERLLCETIAPPPGNVVTDLPPVTQGTTRQRYAGHVSQASCAGCHEVMDPVGFGFERYDAIGGFRLVENGQPVDAHGEVKFSTDLDGAFEGALALGEKLSNSPAARHCLVRQWFRYALGREVLPEDACSLEALERAVDGESARPRDLLLTLATTDAFRSSPAGVAP